MDTEIAYIPRPTIPSVPSQPASYAPYRDTYKPIIIDNGATELRWGFSDWSEPKHGPNVIAKFKERKTNRPVLLFGDGVDVDSGARAQAKCPWEGDILLNFDALENALDYAFVQLGIDTPTVNHPILMTERLCTPLHSRALTSELMFELYSVPTLTFCNDSLMSLYYHKQPSHQTTPFTDTSLVVSFNTASTSVIPVIRGKAMISHAKRIPFGASQASDYLLKLVQLKYPTFPTRMTPNQATWMLHNFTEVAQDYTSQIRALSTDPISSMKKAEQIIQFPFSLGVGVGAGNGGVEGEKTTMTEEELTEKADKRREQGKRLQEIAAEKRAEVLVQKEKDFAELNEFRESKGDEDADYWNAKLDEYGFDGLKELDEYIKKLDLDLKKAAKREAGGEQDEIQEEPVYPLLDIPDPSLSADQIKEKKKQRLMKAGWDARVKIRKEKEREREEQEAKEREEQDERENDFDGWSRRSRAEQAELMSKIKERSRRKAALSDRKSAAAQARMKNIANLAADDSRLPKKKKKMNGDDNFGADDADWAIYRKIGTGEPDDDEEGDLQALNTIESKLLTHDPTFTQQHTYSYLSLQRSALLSAFKPQYDENDIEGGMRIHLNVERWRVPEVWFNPGMAGIDSAGLGEVMANIVMGFGREEKIKLLENIFLTGSPARIPGLASRMSLALRPLMPPEMDIRLTTSLDPSLNAWRGAALYSNNDGFMQTAVTKAEYDEYGGERVKRWWGSSGNGGFIPNGQ